MQRQTVETLAKASWGVALVAFILNFTESSQADATDRITMAYISFGIYALGLILAITALTAGFRFGSSRIFVHAAAGLIINGGLVALFVIIFLMAKHH